MADRRLPSLNRRVEAQWRRRWGGLKLSETPVRHDGHSLGGTSGADTGSAIMPTDGGFTDAIWLRCGRGMTGEP